MEILDSSESFLPWDRNLSELSENVDQDNVLYTTHFSELLDDLSQDALLGQLLSDPFLSGGGGGGVAREEAMEQEGEGLGQEGEESALPPHITAEHSYSLCGDSRPQSPLSHLNGEPGSDTGECTEWTMDEAEEDSMDVLLCDAPSLLLGVPALTLSLEPPSGGPPAQAGGPQSPGPPTPTTPDAPGGPQEPPQTTSSPSKSVKIKQEVIKQEVIPQIKLEPHEVDQFLNLSPKGLESLRMPPTPPSSHGSDSEGSQSPSPSHRGHTPLGEGPLSCPASPRSPGPSASTAAVAAPASSGHKGAVTPRGPASSSSSLSNSPLLTAPHKLQGSGPLLLTEEERRTLVAEGYPVPSKLPLSKAEEKALKKIRRKIKNKISAQESRRKKKEYMDALEKKVETCSNENNELRRKVENLECTNKSLLQQLQSLQSVVTGKVPRSTQTSSCLMVVVLCFAVFLGHFYPSSLTPCSTAVTQSPASSNHIKEPYTTSVKSRNLLSAFEDDQPLLLGLGGDYPDQWEDAPAVVMATWRRSEQQKQDKPLPPGDKPLPPAAPLKLAKGAEPGVAVEIPPFRSNNNETQQRSNSNIVVELHRVEQSSKVQLHLDRTVNETS